MLSLCCPCPHSRLAQSSCRYLSGGALQISVLSAGNVHFLTRTLCLQLRKCEAVLQRPNQLCCNKTASFFFPSLPPTLPLSATYICSYKRTEDLLRQICCRFCSRRIRIFSPVVLPTLPAVVTAAEKQRY